MTDVPDHGAAPWAKVETVFGAETRQIAIVHLNLLRFSVSVFVRWIWLSAARAANETLDTVN
jgi:hypothetical protein